MVLWRASTEIRVRSMMLLFALHSSARTATPSSKTLTESTIRKLFSEKSLLRQINSHGIPEFPATLGFP
jgi:hypothetical protein